MIALVVEIISHGLSNGFFIVHQNDPILIALNKSWIKYFLVVVVNVSVINVIFI